MPLNVGCVVGSSGAQIAFFMSHSLFFVCDSCRRVPLSFRGACKCATLGASPNSLERAIVVVVCVGTSFGRLLFLSALGVMMRCVAASLFISYVVIGCKVFTLMLYVRWAHRRLRGALQAQGVRIIDAAGGLSYAGLAQIRTDSGFGSICGMNQAAADVVCKQLGYGSGVASDSPCGSYGGSDVCGAPGSPVAMQSLTCTGAELAVSECELPAADAS